MRLSSCFGLPIPNDDQRSGRLLAPVRDHSDHCVVRQAWWTGYLFLCGARSSQWAGHRRRACSARSLGMSGSSPPACELPVLRRTNDDLKITIRPPVCTVVGDSTTSGGAMLRNLTIMESVNEEAGTRARDSARLAARRPGRRHQPGAVGVHGRPLCRLRPCERVCFRTKRLTLG